MPLPGPGLFGPPGRSRRDRSRILAAGISRGGEVAEKDGARLRNVACPSCGAPVRFRGATSVVAVCPYCKATLVRDGVNIENIGKQAELLEDHSPIRIGAEGKHRGVGFTIVGRIQYKYGAGVWNEWHVLFPGSKSAWLSDA